MAKVRIKFGEFEIEIEDQEKNIDELLTMAKNEVQSRGSIEDMRPMGERNIPQDKKPPQGGDKGINQYQYVYSFSEDKLSVICKLQITKNSNATKTLAKLYLYGKFLMGEEGPISVEEIREQCKEHGCLDTSNFMSHLKAEKTLIQITGKGKNHNAKLTLPGKEQSKKLAEKYNIKKEE